MGYGLLSANSVPIECSVCIHFLQFMAAWQSEIAQQLANKLVVFDCLAGSAKRLTRVGRKNNFKVLFFSVFFPLFFLAYVLVKIPLKQRRKYISTHSRVFSLLLREKNLPVLPSMFSTAVPMNLLYTRNTRWVQESRELNSKHRPTYIVSQLSRRILNILLPSL